jgi:hypothetical protein
MPTGSSSTAMRSSTGIHGRCFFTSFFGTSERALILGEPAAGGLLGRVRLRQERQRARRNNTNRDQGCIDEAIHRSSFSTCFPFRRRRCVDLFGLYLESKSAASTLASPIPDGQVNPGD